MRFGPFEFYDDDEWATKWFKQEITMNEVFELAYDEIADALVEAVSKKKGMTVSQCRLQIQFTGDGKQMKATVSIPSEAIKFHVARI